MNNILKNKTVILNLFQDPSIGWLGACVEMDAETILNQVQHMVQYGCQSQALANVERIWIPAFAGMTLKISEIIESLE